MAWPTAEQKRVKYRTDEKYRAKVKALAKKWRETSPAYRIRLETDKIYNKVKKGELPWMSWLQIRKMLEEKEVEK